MKKKFRKFFKNKWVQVIGIIIIFSVATIFIVGNGERKEILTLERETFVQETRVAGKVVPVTEAVLGFEQGGMIEEVNVSSGDQVKEGDILIKIDTSEAAASVDLARSDLSYEQASLQRIRQGSTLDQIALAENDLKQAQTDLEKYRLALYNELRRSHTVADSAVRGGSNQVFNNPEGYATLKVSIGDYKLKEDIQDLKRDLDWILESWSDSISSLTINVLQDDIDLAKSNLEIVKGHFEDLTLASSYFEPTSSVSQTTVDKYVSDIASSRKDIQNQIIALDQAIQDLKTAEISLAESERNLNLTSSQASEDASLQAARVSAQQARLRDAAVQLEDGIIRAPFDGIVAQRHFDVGEIALAGDAVIEIIGEGGFEIESFIPEVFVGNVTADDRVFIEFDAYPGREFEGRVVFVEPKETVRDGLSTYKTTIEFPQNVVNILAGMSADLKIEARVSEDVLVVPSRALIRKGGKASVIKIQYGEEVEVGLVLGDVDKLGNQEVIEGLSEGDQIVIYDN